jgi:effector-binding domain-containing protein
MLVDIVRKRTPSYRVASIVHIGPWKPGILRAEFGELTRWAKRAGIPAGQWIFLERIQHRWVACLEIRGRTTVTGSGRIRIRTLPAASVVSIRFDPEAISSRIVYHALHDHVRGMVREGEVRSLAGHRELYAGDPWRDSRAWSECEVQFLLRAR